jgi:hypothetical protein
MRQFCPLESDGTSFIGQVRTFIVDRMTILADLMAGFGTMVGRNPGKKGAALQALGSYDVAPQSVWLASWAFPLVAAVSFQTGLSSPSSTSGSTTGCCARSWRQPDTGTPRAPSGPRRHQPAHR